MVVDTNGDAYAVSGVNVDLGNDVSKILYNASKLTWANRKGKIGEIKEGFSSFSGMRSVSIGNLPRGSLMGINFDGVGTKLEIAERLGNHESVAFDLFAMVCDDAAIRGVEPAIVGSVLDVKSLKKNDQESHIEFVRQLAKGYIAAAKAAGVAVMNGEVAELGYRVGGYGDFNYNWGAGLVWYGKRSRMLTGLDVKPGQYIVAFKENGFRSNGLSLVRKIMKEKYGENWHSEREDLARAILEPSTIYSKALVDMTGGFSGIPKAKITAAAHITGGGIPEKLGRALEPSGLSAELLDLFQPNEAMRELQEIGNIPDITAYKTWNMSNGMLVITPEPSKVIELARKHNIAAREVGFVRQTIKEKYINLASKGVTRTYLRF